LAKSLVNKNINLVGGLMREKVKSLVMSRWFQTLIVSLIIINGITLGLETVKDLSPVVSKLLSVVDSVITSIFVVEIILRVYAHRLSFFKDGWSLFDMTIVLISLFPGNSGFEVFRILRVLRLFRLVTVVPQMRKIVMALLGTLPGIATIAGLLGLLFYMFAIMATHLYGESFPEWFGDLGESFYTLFQIMTLESWSMGIVRPIMEKHPLAWIFFIPFIFIATFIMINLIVAVVVDAMNEMQEETQLDIKEKEDEILEEILSLKAEIAELKELLKRKNSS
jgi:voltage-gated sodium channel